MNNVIQTVVAKGWCKGCGVCVAVCPKQRLKMEWNSHGYYQPEQMEISCGKRCALCLNVCPAHGTTQNETELAKDLYADTPGTHYTKEVGYWQSSYVGYAGDQRLKSASGGLATWVLENLLEEGHVDAVIAVHKTTNPDRLFSFTICHSVHEVRACARSAYYPVAISEILHKVMTQEDKRYAIIALPCVCKALRLAQQHIQVLRKRILFVLGLVCGRQCSKYFAEYVCAMGGGDPHKLKQIVFRAKDLKQAANNLLMQFSYDAGEEQVAEGERLWWDGIGAAFGNSYFQPNGCFFCDDVFAECADVAFMDAWLPQYIKHPKGHNLVITRSEKIDLLLNKKKNVIVLNEINIKQVIRSQQGVLDRKRIRRVSQKNDPMLRTKILRPASPLHNKINLLKREIAFCSNRSWASTKDIGILNNVCRKHFQQLKLYTKISRILNLPVRIFRKITS